MPPDRFAEALERELALEHFDDEPSATTAACSIVVLVGRRRFPTEVAAGDAPVEVEVRGPEPLELPGSRDRITVARSISRAGRSRRRRDTGGRDVA